MTVQKGQYPASTSEKEAAVIINEGMLKVSLNGLLFVMRYYRLISSTVSSLAIPLALLMTFCCGIALAQKVQPKELDAIADASPAAWKEFSPAEGRFAILFPGIPKQSTQPVGEFRLNLFQLHTAFEYSVMYADYPEWVNDSDPALAKKVLDDGLAGAVAEVQSKLLEVQEVHLNKHPGRQYVERMPNGSILRGKTFLVGNRLYQVAVTTPNEDGSTAEAVNFYKTTATKFLDSFRLLEK